MILILFVKEGRQNTYSKLLRRGANVKGGNVLSCLVVDHHDNIAVNLACIIIVFIVFIFSAAADRQTPALEAVVVVRCDASDRNVKDAFSVKEMGIASNVCSLHRES